VLHHAYCSYARDRHEFRLLDQSLLGAFLVSMGGVPGRPAVGNLDRRRGYHLGTLEQACAAFIAKTKLDPDWPE